MRLLLCVVLAVITLNSCKNFDNEAIETTYYFIRHAEKDRSNPSEGDPELTEKGHQRATFWAQHFAEVPLDAVYSTNYKRTTSTAVQTAISKKLEVQLYDPRNLNDSLFIKNTLGKRVLVVGHSNTTPAFVNAVLGEEKYESIDDSNNGNLYTVTIKGGVISSELQRLENN